MELGLLLPDDAIFDPDQFSYAVVEAAARLGTQVHLGVGVNEILVRNGKVEGVRTPHGLVHTPVVVCAAGTSSHELCRPLGINLPYLISSTKGAITSKQVPHQLPSIIGLDNSLALTPYKGAIHLEGNHPPPLQDQTLKKSHKS